MASAERRAHRAQHRRGALLPTIALWTALVASALPLLRVIDSGAWVTTALFGTAVVLAVGWGARRLLLAAVVVPLLELLTCVVFLTAAFLPTTGIFVVIPTSQTVVGAQSLLAQALDEIAVGAAPLSPTLALSFCLVAAIMLLSVAMDHVVLTARMPLLAGLALVAVSVIAQVIVPGDFSAGEFVFLAASILFLLWTETRRREKSRALQSISSTDGHATTARRHAGRGAAALAIGTVAVITALVVTPLLPAPVARTQASTGLAGTSINPTLRLGDDLRQPNDVDVLTFRTTLPTAPYLRAATLSTLDGAVWTPDEGGALALTPGSGVAAITAGGDIARTAGVTTIDIEALNSGLLPVPYPATDVTGLSGDWEARPEGGTVTAVASNTRGQSYAVTSEVPRPTREQIQASDAGGSGNDDLFTEMPSDIPSNIAQLASEVTAGAATDYDALIALQSWFRGSEFEYSLDAPVEEDFDGSGMVAVSKFLEVRSGYCVHFASAFASMARTLDMPSRIVVGYLPGVATTDVVGEQRVYQVSSSQLHAWPEVYFDGIGWVAFEPTKSLGTATVFSATPTNSTDTTEENAASAQPTAPSASPSTSNGRPADALDQNSAEAAGEGDALGSTIGILGLVVLLLAMPGLVAALRRGRRLHLAHRGDAHAAWAFVVDSAIDLGIAISASASPRAVAAHLRDSCDSALIGLNLLVPAIERAAYSPAGTAASSSGLADAAASVRDELRASASPVRRAFALAAPRSIVVRPAVEVAK
ncbi:transglutaminase-like putative cysteine protease [Microbacterium endophyticum]|uniref:Transglutaminase-like putative cysteine protease n=1 Tax=Microbacterium endophyticum TaxID=1526412 RepID=A0A7W4V2W6_9MICO|nr:DUF3488 and transglutaminase-like domain-containing protein [Microbacterium endophyticum]MBB2975168.1 transglutaminase-like putative cysteine protease [Microbacterium endophyticum]NIK37292.1 transglutaminase-like putative cysteine protease [Microbacterium endophyticum]